MAINVIAHDELTSSDLVGLRRLFDAEYLDDFGEWPRAAGLVSLLRSVRLIGRVGRAKTRLGSLY